MKLSNKIILLFIIIVAAVLRFYHYSSIPFTFDELSALLRTRFDTFNELIAKGVMPDGHPAGIQVFLFYWNTIAGDTEWIIKLPFTLMGIASVWLVWAVAREWYNETTALIAASYTATLQYTVMYSNIARPYISGLLFSLMMVLYWTRMMRNPQRKFLLNSILFVISASLCAYNHYFSLVLAFITGISGLFIIEKKYLRKYILCGVLVFVLYIPHLKIFFHQLSLGGVESWLAKPHYDFILSYLAYLSDFSVVVGIVAVGLIVYAILTNRENRRDYKREKMFALWFLLPLITGFIYSKYFNAVLQYSVLIFSFPYLLFVLFGFIREQKTGINALIVAAIMIANSYALVYERHHFSIISTSPVSQLLADSHYAKKENKNVTSVIDSHKEFSEFYFNRKDVDTSFIWFDSFGSKKEFISFLKDECQKADFLYLGCSSSNDPLTVSIIRDYYPTLEWQKNYFTATSYLFSKKRVRDIPLIDSLTFENEAGKRWSQLDAANIHSDSCTDNHWYLLDSSDEYALSFSAPLKSIMTDKNNFIDISLCTNLNDGAGEACLVASLSAGKKNIYWSATPFRDFATDDTCNDGRVTVHHSLKLSDVYMNYRNVQLDIYIWNKGGQCFSVDDYEISLREGNPVLYGLFEKTGD